MNASNAYQALVSIASENWLIERLFFASLEFAVLALFLGALVFFLQLRSARLISLLWLLVLTKPLVSLAIGSPIPVVQLLIPPSRELSAGEDTLPTVNTIDLMNEHVSPQAPAEIRFAHTVIETDNRTPEPREQPSAGGAASITAEPWRLRWPEIRVAHLVVAIWLAGIAYFAIVELLRQFRTRRLVASSLPPSTELSDHLARLAKQISSRRMPSLRITDQLESPALVGVFRPVILIPAWLADEGRTNMSTITWTLRHELMHWKLGDPIANSIARLAQILYFFHPAALVEGKQVDSAQVEAVAKPTKPIVGTIRAKDNGQPLAGVVIYGDEEAHHRGVRAVTDAEGRYRLVGLPKAGQYELTFYPPIPLGYLGTRTMAADTEGLSPLTVDLELRRGVEVRARFVDKVTREPVRGHVQTTPLRDNPYYQEAELHPGLIPSREWRRHYAPDMDGVFHLVAYPGPSLVFFCAQANAMKYLRAHVDPADIERDFVMGFAELSPGYRVIDTQETDQPLVFDVELDPGRTLTGTLIGPNQQPVVGATAHGLNYHTSNLRNVAYKPEWENESLATDDFSVRRLEPQTARTVSFVHKDRKLIGQLVLHGDEKGPLEVQLNRWGTATGRLLDEQGKPLKGVRVELQYSGLPAPGMRPRDEVVQTDADGRFRVQGLAPGLKHELALERTSQRPAKDGKEQVVTYSAGDRLTALSVPAGEVEDLGDIRVSVAKPEQVDP